MGKEEQECPVCYSASEPIPAEDYVHRCLDESCNALFLACPVCLKGVASFNTYCDMPDICGENCPHIPVYFLYGPSEYRWASEAEKDRMFQWALEYSRKNPDYGEVNEEDWADWVDSELLDIYAEEQGWEKARISDIGSHGTAATDVYFDFSGKLYSWEE